MSEERRTINQSELATMFKKDRATIRTWLIEEDIKPTNSNKRNYLYDYDEATACIQRRTNQKWKDLKTENEAKLIEVKLQKELSAFAPVAEFAELTHQWVGWLFTKFDKKFPDIIVNKVAKAKNKQEAVAVVKREVQSIFNDFRSNPKKFLEGK